MSSEVEDLRVLLNDAKAQAELFRSIAAHDLREPLTTILSYIDALTTDGIFSPEEIQDVLPRIRENAIVGLRLVTELLDLARSSPTVTQIKPVDLNDLMEGVLEDLSKPISDAQTFIKIGDLGTLNCDPQQIAVLLRNLIENALKLRHATEGPRIEIFADDDAANPGYRRLHVRDNGVGFNESHFADYLKPFHRSPGKVKDGFGMSLSVCQRIVLNHKGKFTATSQPGQGAQLTVSLPA